MLLNVFILYSVVLVKYEYLVQEIAELRIDQVRVSGLALHHLLVNAFRIFGVERCLSGHDLNKENPEAPYIDLITIRYTFQNLRSDVGRCTTIGLSPPIVLAQHLGEAEVHKFHVPPIRH